MKSTAPYVFKLYVLGDSLTSKRTLANFNRFAKAQYGDGFQLIQVDILSNPAVAETDRILAIPTLVRVQPLPQIRIIGDLSNREMLAKLIAT